jgi:hypothetical protein
LNLFFSPWLRGEEKEMDLEINEGLREYYAESAARLEIARRAERANLTVHEYLDRQAVKYRAKRLGLVYWPALAYGPKVDPRAFLMAEQVLAKKSGSYWGEILSDGSRSNGGWDSWGHYGLAPSDIARMWYAAGCRNSKKFRLQVATGIFARKGESVPQFAAYVRGWRWLRSNRLEGMLYLSRKAVAALGRLTWHSRWAAINNLPQERDKPLRTRDLNWAAVKIAQKGSRSAIMAGYAPVRWGWEQMFSNLNLRVEWKDVADVLRLLNPFEVAQSTLHALLSTEKDVVAANFIPAVYIALLFGRDMAAACRFVKANGGLHDAGQFTLPTRGSQWDRKGWAGLANHYPVQIREWLSVAGIIERELGHIPSDLAEIRYVATCIPGLTDLAYGVLLSQPEKADYKRLWASPPKAFVGIPAPGGKDGIKIDELHLVQLAHDDLIQPLAGRLVNCCQHLHGAAASCARQSWTEGDAAIWAVFEDGRMVAQSFVWRSKAGNAIVLDSIEALARRQAIADIFLTAAKVVVGEMGIRKVYVGSTSYGVSDMLSNTSAVNAPECAFSLSYTDARSVRLVCEVNDENRPAPGKVLRKAMAQAVAEAQQQQTALGPVNELMEGSDVFCEYCNAEVHPDCEICPSCGANISEWVEEE